MPDTVLGLPLHPLVVHAVVVLLPLAALGALALVARPAWRRPYGPLVAATAVAGAGSAFVARLAGDALLESLTVGPALVEQLDRHGRFGLWTVVTSLPFAVLAVAAVLADRRGARGPAGLLAVLSCAAGLLTLVATLLAGHSGATAVWNPGG